MPPSGGIDPDATLPSNERIPFPETKVQVTNETTLGASLRLVKRGLRPLALNFANGVRPGRGLPGRCQSAGGSALSIQRSLRDTGRRPRLYREQRKRPQPDSTDWAIYSPDVPFFRADDGTALQNFWLLSVITCAAPYAPVIGQPRSGDLLKKRIHRVLAIARSYGHSNALVLGAWGCGRLP